MSDGSVTRRDVLLLTLSMMATAPRAGAGESTKLFRIGFLANTVPLADLMSRVPSNPAPRLIEDGLRELGWVAGKNIEIVWKSAEGRYGDLPQLAEELVRQRVDVIVAFGPGVKAAAEKTATIPIVMSTGLVIPGGERVSSFARPGSNITGIVQFPDTDFIGKCLSLLKQLSPRTSRVAILEDTPPTAEDIKRFQERYRTMAGELGLTLFEVGPRSPDRLDEAFLQASREGANAILVSPDPMFHWREHQETIHLLAIRHRLPVLHNALSAAESGGLMAYGADINDAYRRMPRFIDRILRGAKPGDLPIERPTKFELVINLKAARAIGLTFPPSLLIAANRVIE